MTDTNDQLFSLIQSIPLLEPQSSVAAISPTLFEGDPSNASIYFGTGLTTSKAMSVGMPFDVVGMLSVAERLRRHLGFGRIFQLIANTHAKSNPFIRPDEVDALAARVKETMQRLARTMGMESVYVPVLSSEFDATPEYREIFTGIDSPDHEYVRREWADIEFLRRHHGLRLKLSWIIGAKVNKVGFDERLYDPRFSEVTGQSMSFVYLWPGRTLDRERPRVSPYISTPGERRVLLTPGEDVAAKLAAANEVYGDDKVTRGVIDHWAMIVAQYEAVVDSLGDRPTPEKVQMIIDRVFA